MLQPKKSNLKKTSKETITTKSKKGTMTYNADKKGNVSTTKMTPDKKIAFTTSMDTTGYAAGKPYFKHTISKSKGTNRRKSFCARMSGMPGPAKKPNGEPTRKTLALRKWNC